MARTIIKGDVAEIELTINDEDGQVVATCVDHQGHDIVDACPWTERYDGMRDAVEYAADHADRGVS